MTKEAIAQQVADAVQIRGISVAAAAWMFSQLKKEELIKVASEYGIKAGV